MNQRIAPGVGAFALMVLLCAIWGFQQVAMKLAAAGISPIMQAALRSVLGAVLVFAWARWRRPDPATAPAKAKAVEAKAADAKATPAKTALARVEPAAAEKK